MEILLASLPGDLAPSAWLLAAAAAVMVGMAKNGVPGFGILAVPLVAMVFPARLSVGALLPLLIVGDIMAILHFRRHADRGVLMSLLPWTFAGIAAGAGVLLVIASETLKPLLGGLVLLLVFLEWWRMQGGLTLLAHRRAASPALGIAAGVATTVGNAAGPLMSLYLLSRGFQKHQFVGTSAWFFFIINTSKIPVFVSLNMITRDTLMFNLVMAPLVVVGSWIGRRVFQAISEKVFVWLVLLLSAAAALKLLVGG